MQDTLAATDQQILHMFPAVERHRKGQLRQLSPALGTWAGSAVLCIPAVTAAAQLLA
jgi:hypothetical protein